MLRMIVMAVPVVHRLLCYRLAGAAIAVMDVLFTSRIMTFGRQYVLQAPTGAE